MKTGQILNLIGRWALSALIAIGGAYLVFAFVAYDFFPKDWGYYNRLFAVLVAALLFLVVNIRSAPED